MENNLTIEQIQAVIDKGGCLVSELPQSNDSAEIHFGALSLNKDEEKITSEFSKFLSDGSIRKNDYIEISCCKIREATPEEIEKYVHVEYRPKNMITDTKYTFIGGMNNKMETHDVQFISPNSYKVKFFAIDPDLIRSDVQHEVFSKSDLISFGNYLLSKERDEMIISKPERGIVECVIVIRQVSDADYENWKIK